MNPFIELFENVKFWDKDDRTVLIEEPSKYSLAIQKTHDEFNTAGNVLLAEAKEILRRCAEEDVDKGKKLLKLGFLSNPQALEAKINKDSAERALKIAKTVEYYHQKYPLYKFIDEEAVKTICAKYGLNKASIWRYKGFVPAKNLKDIERFKVSESDKAELYSYKGKEDMKWEYCSERAYNDNYNDSKYYDRIRAMMQICAPIKDINTENSYGYGYNIVDNYPDPVVLQPVKDGYLIVTAWGDEASDPIVVNQLHN